MKFAYQTKWEERVQGHRNQYGKQDSNIQKALHMEKAQLMKFTAEKCNNTDNKSCADNILEDIHLEKVQFT